MDIQFPPITDCLNDAMNMHRVQGSSMPRDGAPIHYIWLHVTRDGIADNRSEMESAAMLLNDWLNVVDESAALGAKWMIVYLDAPIDVGSDVWKICAWGQEVHDIRVGLHISSRYLKEVNTASLNKLQKDKTFVIVDESALETMSFLRDEGYTLCHANIGDEDRKLPCTHTDSIVCAGADGVMFCCGLVMGQESYRLGNVRSDTVDHAMQNHATLEPIGMNREEHHGACDGCPPIMARRFTELQS